jgi:serine phosphatase RsbU (regulator of sigma subunit)
MALIAVCATAHATSVLELDKWMQRIEKRALSMQRNLQREAAEASVSDAREIEALYGLMQRFFEEAGNAEEAVRLSRQGRQAAAQIAEHAAGKKFTAARTVVKSMMRDCRSCHRDYKPLD